jgi:hypothetical protein
LGEIQWSRLPLPDREDQVGGIDELKGQHGSTLDLGTSNCQKDETMRSFIYNE